MSQKIYVVELSCEERTLLRELISKGRAAAHKRSHAQILLWSDRGPQGPGWSDQKIAQALDIGLSTPRRVRKRLVEEGFEAALERKKQSRRRRIKIDGQAEAALIATACSPAPKGRARWTLRLLADRLIELRYVDSVSIETVRQKLKKTFSSHG